MNPLKPPTMCSPVIMLGLPSGNLKLFQIPLSMAQILLLSLNSRILGFAAALLVDLLLCISRCLLSNTTCLQSPSVPKPALHYDTAVNSDDNSPPAPSLNLSSMNNMPGTGISMQNPRISGFSANPQPKGKDPATFHSQQMPFLNAMGSKILLHGVLMGPELMSHNPTKGHGSQEPRMGFSPVWISSTAGTISLPWPHWRQSIFPGDMGVAGKGTLGHPNNLPPNSAALWKPAGPRGPDPFTVLGNSMSSVLMDPDLQVIPELNLSSITSKKPSQTLKYFHEGKSQAVNSPRVLHLAFCTGDDEQTSPQNGTSIAWHERSGVSGNSGLMLGTGMSMPVLNPVRSLASLKQEQSINKRH
ncbi:hypothetical protein HPG69_003294 [Diceros bicornis minor]|uniref:Uncharacterized protein n=1 Tax=Diceros bicornis minor TaxID=77932 RepID=A0A7J7E858_DICBM|nr:hypothetical protein HPG69_003294 [Diceros bicornis minor]